jgi:hypothetical protein
VHVTVTADWWEERQEKAPSNHRYHCTSCGRFVPTATVQAGWGRYEPYEWEANGTCGSCGRVEVHWGPL